MRERIRRFGVRVARHARWVRREGLGRLIEEDQLDPRARAALSRERARWLAEHPGIAPKAVPVFVVGVQRSGTNMLMRGFETSPAFDACNENDRRAFERFRLRPLPRIREIVEGSGHRYVVFKPLMESHRTPELLDDLGTPSPPLALWAYRSVDGRVRSAVAKFGPNNLLALRSIAEGGEDRRWSVSGPAQEVVDTIRAGLSEDSLAFVRSFDYDALDPDAGAALFWYVRNRLYFELGLHDRGDVTLSSYERVVREPEETLRMVSRFLGTPYEPAFAAHVDARASSPPSVTLPMEIRARCDELETRLSAAADEKAARIASRPAVDGAGTSAPP